MRMVFLTNIPSPYRVDFFNELGKYCELTVIFEKSMSKERHQSWNNYRFDNFKGIILEGIGISADKSFSTKVTKYLNNNEFDKIVVSNPFTPTGMLAIRYMKKHHLRYWIEGDGALTKKDRFIKRFLKTYLIGGADGYFSTSATHDSYYIYYGAKPELIHRYPFSSVREERVLSYPVSPNEKRTLKEKLGIKEKNVVLSVGQFIYRKGFDVLLDAALLMDRSIGIYIIGGKATPDMESFVEKHQLKNVHFLEFCDPAVLCLYYKAADVFVLPTREDIWGLVVNEAMASGLPVVTTDRCVAGLELVKNGENGYIVPVGDSVKLSEAIIDVLNSTDSSVKMPKAALVAASLYTIQSMVEAHLKLLVAQ